MTARARYVPLILALTVAAPVCAQDVLRELVWAPTSTIPLTIGVESSGRIVVEGTLGFPPREGPTPNPRELFDAADVARWVAAVRAGVHGVDSARTVRSPTLGLRDSTFTLGRWGTAQLDWTLPAYRWDEVRLSWIGCGSFSPDSLRLTRADAKRLLDVFDRAVAVSRHSPASPLVTHGARPYFRHEVSCPAVPDPMWPLSRDDRLASTLWAASWGIAAEFVVDTDGRVDPATLRVMPGTDGTHVHALRAVLPRWRFRPATRSGIPVPQLVDTVLVARAPGPEPEPALQFDATPPDARAPPTTLKTLADTAGWVHAMFAPGSPGQVDEWFTPDDIDQWAIRVAATGRAADSAIAGTSNTVFAFDTLGRSPGALVSLGYAILGGRASPPIRVVLVRDLARCGRGGSHRNIVVEPDSGGLARQLGVPAMLAAVGHMPEWQAAARAARANAPVPQPPGLTVRDPWEVACPARINNREARVLYPPSREQSGLHAEVFSEFIVDSSGQVDLASIQSMPDADPRAVALVRPTLARWRFQPASRGGVAVPERVAVALTFEPPRIPASARLLPPPSPQVLQVVEGIATGPRHPDHHPARLPSRPADPPITRYDPRAELAPLDERHAVPEALGMRALADTVLPPGTREVRIWTGILIGYPHNGLRIVDRDGVVSGQWIRFWPLDTVSLSTDAPDSVGGDAGDSAAPGLDASLRRDERGRCSIVRTGRVAAACVVRFARPPNWKAMLARLERANVWDLPDESALPRHGRSVDGWGVQVEVRRGAQYRSYRYKNPQALGLPEGQQALALLQAVDSLYPLARHTDAYRSFRGYYLHDPHTSELVPCTGGERWGAAGALAPARAVVGDAMWSGADAPESVLYVEGAGTVSPLPKPNDALSRTPLRAVRIDTLTVARIASLRDCR